MPSAVRQSLKQWKRGAALAAALWAARCSGSSPTTPTPTAPVLACPGAAAGAATSTAGGPVTYAAPAPSGGRAPFTVTCTPASGQLFPVGATPVSCTATDAAGATAACTFTVTVTAAPRLTRTRFLAFGDSITAGEVTVPVTNAFTTQGAPLYRQILVPPASYPSVLSDLLGRRYFTQSVTVINEGRPGQAAADAYPRYQTAMATTQPDVLLLLMGYNDLGSTSAANAGYRVVERMAQDARNRGVRVFLGTLTPTIPNRQRSEPVATLLAYNDSIRALAAGEQAVLVDLYQAALPDVEGWIGIDGLHPTEAGYAKIAQTFFAAIRANLEAP